MERNRAQKKVDKIVEKKRSKVNIRVHIEEAER